MKYRRCRDKEVLIVTGCCHGDTKFIKQGTVFCWPGEKLSVINTHVRTVDLRCEHVQSTTNQGDHISFVTETSIAAIIPKDNDSFLKTASELFLDKSDVEINKVISEITEGCHKELAAEMSVNEIVHNHHGFNRGMFDMVSSILDNYGMVLLEVNLTHIKFPTDEIRNAVCSDTKIGEVKPEDTKVIFY